MTDTSDLLSRGFALHQSGDLDGASALYARILAADPGQADALHLLGLCRWQSGAGAEAVDLLRRAAVAAPRSPAIRNNLANMLLASGRRAEAVDAYRSAIDLKPDYAEAMSNLGTALQEGGHAAEAEAWQRRALAQAPDRAETWTNLGSVLTDLGRREEAERCHRRALNLNPRLALAMSNLGTVLRQTGRAAEAVDCFRQALALEPGQPTARYNLALDALGRGDLRAGWPDYGYRFAVRRQQRIRRPLMPAWTGDDPAGRRILVWREQGVGDEILFSGLYPDLIRQAGRVIIECDRRLVPLFSRSFPQAVVRAEPPPGTGEPDDADAHIPAGDLPAIYRARQAAFPTRRSWLVPDQGRVDGSAAWLNGLGPRLKVGFCWRSGLKTADREGLYSALADWGGLFALADIDWIVLQYDADDPDTQRELADAARLHPVTLHRPPGLDLRDDLDGVAALMSGLDLVISAGTAVAELAGALGVPTWRIGGADDWTCLGTAARPWFPAQRSFTLPPGASVRDLLDGLARELRRARAAAHPRPQVPPGTLERAAALHKAGRGGEAEPLYRAVLAADPDNPVALHLLGLARLQAGQPEEAVPLMERAVTLLPDYVAALCNLGNALRKLGRSGEALARYDAALALKPAGVEILVNLANCLVDLDRAAEAEIQARKAVAHAPANAHAHDALGLALAAQDRYRDAMAAHGEATRLAPGRPEPWINLGIAATKADRLDEAQTAFAAALALDPRSIGAETNLANVEARRGNVASAEARQRRLLARVPDDPDVLVNLAQILTAQGRREAALAALDRAVASRPAHALARWNRGHLLLAMGRLAEGWSDYDARFDARQVDPRRSFRLPRWRGDDPRGKTILAWREQGLGDEIMFAGLLPALQAACGRLIVECDPRLVGLLRRALPGATVRAPTDDPVDADFHVPVGSLPSVFATRLSQLPIRAGWLTADPDRRRVWADRLERLGPGLRVGVCWRSGLRSLERDRAYLSLTDLAPLLTLPGLHVIDLQYDDAAAEIMAAESALGIRVHRWPDLDQRNDLDSVAALISELDLVISVATSVGEMAAALGVPVWRYEGGGDWTSMGTDVRPLFPSMRCFRRLPGQDAGTVVQRMRAALLDLFHAGSRETATAPPSPPDLSVGVALHREGRLPEAAALYREVLRAVPDDADALHLLGLVLHQSGQNEEAERHVAQAVRLDPGFGTAWNSLGSIRRALGDPSGAADAFRSALAQRPDYPEALTNLGAVLTDLRQFGEAIDAHRRALALRPDYPRALANLGIALRRAGRPEDALETHRRALALDPDLPDAWGDMGLAHMTLSRFQDADRCQDEALARAPDYAEAHVNRALIRLECRDPGGARKALADALALRPDYPLARYDLALLDLADGRLDRGWDGYVHRFRAGQASPRPDLPLPDWTGDDIRGRRVLVWREQGLGDELMFAALYPDLIARAGHVIIECDPRLVPLFARSFPTATVRPETRAAADADVQIAAGSVPAVLGRTLDQFTGDSYLIPDPERVIAWQDRLAALGPGLRIGLCWRSQLMTADRARDYTTIEDWAPVFAIPGLVFVSLQYDGGEAEILEAERRFGIRIHRWADVDLKNDLESAAALTGCLDLVLSVATAVGEMAGALGVPVWRVGGWLDWSQLGTGARPWFASMRVWNGGPWGSVTRTPARIARELLHLLASAPAGPGGPTAEDLLETAVDLHQRGQLDGAAGLYRRVLAQRADDPVALHLLGVTRLQQGRAGEAVELIGRAVAVAPGYGPALVNLGNALQAVGRPAEAEQRYRAALVLRPDAPDILTNLGNALRAQGRYPEAVDCHRAALAAAPALAEAHANLGAALKDLDRPPEAEAALRRALDLGHGTADTLTMLGEVVRIRGAAHEAIHLHGRAIAQAPGHAEAHNNLGRALEPTGDVEGARRAYRRALDLNPTLPTARFNLGLLDLASGNLPAGWEGYAARFDGAERHPRRRLRIPEWQGEDLSGRRILVWREQGVGDELMFAALYRDLIARAGHVVIECEPRLVRLFSRSFPAATVRAVTDDPTDADLAVAAGSLPRFLMPDLAGWGAGQGWLVPDAEATARLRQRLDSLGPGLKVGLCWRSRDLTTERSGAYTRLRDWMPLLRLPGVRVMSLQYDGAGPDIAELGDSVPVPLEMPDVDLMNDLDGAAALTAALDLVVSAPTAVAEMAGALGVPTWRVAPPDWTCLGTAVRPWFPTQWPVDLRQGPQAAVDCVVRRITRSRDPGQ